MLCLVLQESSYCYWPGEEGEEMVCGRLRVKLARVKAHSDIVERKMEVTLTEDTTTHSQSLIVNTLQLISWPREGLPHPKSTILLMEMLTGALMKSTTKKTVVMCRSMCSMLECLHASLILSLSLSLPVMGL